MRSIFIPGAMLLLAAILNAPATGWTSPAPQKKEYLSRSRSRQNSRCRRQRIRASCFLRPSLRTASRSSSMNSRTSIPTDEKRTERLNGLINSYAGCIDDAADLIELGIEKQEDIRDGVKAMQERHQGISALSSRTSPQTAWNAKPIRTIWTTPSRPRRMRRWTSRKPPRRCLGPGAAQTHRERIFPWNEERTPHVHRAFGRRPHFSAHLHAPGMPGPASAISGRVVPIRQSLAHSAPAPGRGLRAALRYFAGGAGSGD